MQISFSPIPHSSLLLRCRELGLGIILSLTAIFFETTTITRMRGVSPASIITRRCFGSLILLVRQLMAWVVDAQMQSEKHKVVP